MLQIALYIAVGLVMIHGLVHLLGFVAYWPLAEVAELPYKTTLLGERWSIGPDGMRLYSVLWLVAALGLVGAMVGLLTRQSWWLAILGAAVIVSLIITALDWSNAFRGAILSSVLLVPLLVMWGLHIQPQPFSTYPKPTPELATIPLPAGLPAPVARYYRTIMGEEVPVIESAVITTRGTLRFAGITFPARLRFTHDAGQGYRHYIETTLFGYPVMKINERYLDGKAWMALPVGVIENEPKIDMAANLGLWGESFWLPSIFITDPRVRWEAVDDTTARLVVPFDGQEDTLTVYFDAETGLIQRMEAMRYRQAADTEKILWQFEPLAWDEFHDMLIPSSSTVTWADEGTPWLVNNIDGVAYNVDVSSYIRAEGP